MNDSKHSEKHIVTINLPFAVFFMTLMKDKELNKHNGLFKTLVEPLTSDGNLDNISEEIYNNHGKNIIFQDDDEKYKDILENRNSYSFQSLFRLFKHFYDIDIKDITSCSDIKECYRIIFEHRCTIPGKGKIFEPEYCWKIASIFINESESEKNITIEDSYIIRKEMISQASNTIYITGTTLKEAFSVSSDNKEKTIIDTLFNNGHIKTINIFLLNHSYLNLHKEDGSHEIEQSILNILDYAEATHNCPEIKIILLTDLNIPFALITQEKMLKRNTFLFTKEREYKGQYGLFGNETEEYSSYLSYLLFLISNSYSVNITENNRINERIHKSFKLQDRIDLRKIQTRQLLNIVRSSFYKIPVKDEKSIYKYISSPDSTQKILLPYLEETQKMLNTVIRQHDSSGWAKIIPSIDLGIPNNIMRIAGGFLTGALYDWKCSVPIVPVDATVNTCTSSVFQLKNFNSDITNDEFKIIIDKLQKISNDNGFALNFESGNHFLTVAEDDNNNSYLILHSSARQCKETCFGLYPSERVWFKDNIKTIYNENRTRYLRYIRDDAAVRFTDYSDRFRDFNVEIHKFVADTFAELCNTRTIGIPIIEHHYGMPTPNTIVIGAFLVMKYKKNNIIPLFSDYNKDLCLFEVSNDNAYYKLASTGEEVIIAPHGWGQAFDGIKEIEIDNITSPSKRMLAISYLNEKKRFEVNSSARITLAEKHVRNYKDINAFISKYHASFKGESIKTLHPIVSYCNKNKIIDGTPIYRTDKNI